MALPWPPSFCPIHFPSGHEPERDLFGAVLLEPLPLNPESAWIRKHRLPQPADLANQRTIMISHSEAIACRNNRGWSYAARPA